MKPFESPYCQLTPGCSNFREGKIEGCASCNNRLRREAKQEFSDSLKKKRALPKPVKAVAKRSVKKVKEDREYTVLRKKFLEEYQLCQCSLYGPCNQKSETIHHTSMSAKNYLNTETWLAVSLEHHMIIENRSAEYRREHGLLKD